MIILINRDKLFDKIQHLFMVKLSKSIRIYISIIQAIHDKSTNDIRLNSGRLANFPLRGKNQAKAGGLQIPGQWVTTGILYKRYSSKKGICEISACRWYGLIIRKPQSPLKVLKLIDKSSIVIGYKINIPRIPKPVLFLYASELTQNEIKKPIPSVIEPIKYLSVNLDSRWKICMLKSVKY